MSGEYEKGNYIEKLKEQFFDLKKGVNLILIDKDNMYTLEQELSTYSFFNEPKLIIVKLQKKSGDEEESKGKKEWLTDDLEEKISKIDSYEAVNYKLKGFNVFLLNSFKYVGLLMLSPLKGVIPSIATETLITRNVVGNLYNNLEWEENKRMVYNAIDYSSSINGSINDLDYTSRIVDGTLEDIVNLKIWFRKTKNHRPIDGDLSCKVSMR